MECVFFRSHLVPLMTQDGGNAEQFQGAHEGIRTLPLNAVECEKNDHLHSELIASFTNGPNLL